MVKCVRLVTEYLKKRAGKFGGSILQLLLVSKTFFPLNSSPFLPLNNSRSIPLILSFPFPRRRLTDTKSDQNYLKEFHPKQSLFNYFALSTSIQSNFYRQQLGIQRITTFRTFISTCYCKYKNIQQDTFGFISNIFIFSLLRFNRNCPLALLNRIESTFFLCHFSHPQRVFEIPPRRLSLSTHVSSCRTN